MVAGSSPAGVASVFDVFPRAFYTFFYRGEGDTVNLRKGLQRLQVVYFAIAAIVVAYLTIAAGGDDKVSGWERISNPTIVYWADDRGLPDILSNQFYLPASLTNEQAKARLVAEGKVSPSESVIPLFIYTWNDFLAWPVMWIGIAATFGVWIFGLLVAWVICGFRQDTASADAPAQSQISLPQD